MSIPRKCVMDPLLPFFTDWKLSDPSLTQLLGDVYEDIRNRVTTRGTDILYLSFPEIGKGFDKGLSTGYFNWGSVLEELSLSRSSTLAMLLSLYFESESSIATSKAKDPTSVFFMRTFLFFYKKIKIPCEEDRVVASINSFIETDAGLPHARRAWGNAQEDFLTPLVWDEMNTPIGKLVSLVSFMVLRDYPDIDSIDLSPKHGPGAVAEGGRFSDKYHFSNWSTLLDSSFPMSSYGTHDLTTYLCDDVSPPSRVCAVPKTQKGPRLITIEPCALQFCQQAILGFLRDNLSKYLRDIVRFDDQSYAQGLARTASLGDLVTIDLSEASDRLSLRTVEFVFRHRPDILRYLNASRNTRFWTTQTGDSLLTFNKYAGMGNATTFPVQSIVYAIFVIASYMLTTGASFKQAVNQLKGRSSVFGDDIISPKSCAECLISTLNFFSFKVNTMKTHTEGFFRESCGGDYLEGDDVTPFYMLSVDIDKGNIISWVEGSNNAYIKGLWNLSAWMMSRVPSRELSLIPVTNLQCFSLRFHCFQHTNPRGVASRYNKHLHNHEWRHVIYVSVEKRRRRGTIVDLFQYFIEALPRTVSSETHAGWSTSSVLKRRCRWSTAYGM